MDFQFTSKSGLARNAALLKPGCTSRPWPSSCDKSYIDCTEVPVQITCNEEEGNIVLKVTFASNTIKRKKRKKKRGEEGDTRRNKEEERSARSGVRVT